MKDRPCKVSSQDTSVPQGVLGHASWLEPPLDVAHVLSNFMSLMGSLARALYILGTL
jgi:hypothetical protein